MRRMHATIAFGTLVATTLFLAGASTSAQAGTLASRSHRESVIVEDIQIPVPGAEPVAAYVVRPQRTHGQLAGVLFLHWFEPGQSTQNRAEFLAEAVELAGRGVVSVLPQLRFPWEGDPVGDARDLAAVTGQFDQVRRAYSALLDQPGVNPHRTAVVGHDYGAMYGAILAQRDPRVRTGIFMAGDSTWANWFDTYWLDLPADQKPAYRAQFAALDPVNNVSRLGASLFFQWGDRDPFVTPEVRDAFAAANPAAKATLYTRADHFLTQTAKEDRLAWLTAQLSL